MSTLFASLLIVHVIIGLIGVIGSYMVVMTLLKSQVSVRRLRITSAAAFLSYMVAWFTGGYYYWFYYGPVVKPLIKAGDYVWAHNVVMEAKEHIFLMLPILAFTVLGISLWSSDRLSTDSAFKTSVIYLASVTLALAVSMAIGGIIISGGAR